MHVLSLKLLPIAVWLTSGMASVANADVVAVYTGDRENGMTIEVAADGAARIGMTFRGRGRAEYILVRDSQIYMVGPGPGGPIALSAEALAYLQGSVAAKQSPLVARKARSHAFPLKPGAKIEIGGFMGQRYVSTPGAPELVLSDDPRLKPIGKVLDLLSAQATGFLLDGAAEWGAVLRPLLADRGVLAFAGMQLSQAKFDVIDPARFALPARTVALADVKEDEPAIDVSEGQHKADAIVQAAYSNGSLYLLNEAGSMEEWAAGAPHGRPFAVPEALASFCISSGTLWAVPQESKGLSQLWSWRITHDGAETGKSWIKVGSRSNAAAGRFLALDCSGSEPIVISTQQLWMPLSEREIPLAGEPLSQTGFVTSHLQGDVLWLGFNAGEWSGGIRRISLAKGTVDIPGGTDPDGRCEEGLNPSCNAVTGITNDPSRADCVLVAMGVVHMLSGGGVARICGSEASPVYAKPYTMNPDWHWTGKPDDSNESTVAFHSMKAERNGEVWAVAADGVYRFTKAPLPEFSPLPKRRVRSPVDWSNPDYILISTDMNRRHSLSGSSWLLVLRGN